MRSSRKVLRASAAIAGLTLASLSLAACSGGSSSDTKEGKVEISWLTPNDEVTVKLSKAMVEAFQKQNPNITVNLETQPGGTEGDNLLKTKLATGEVSDVFYYNSGSLFQALNPDATMVNLSDEAWVKDLTDDYKRVVSTDKGLYGAPITTSRVGGMVYNKKVFSDLGLKVPTSWNELVKVAEVIKAEGGITPVGQAYGDSWTSQLMILADFANINSADKDWAEKYTAGKAKFADEPALDGFKHLEAANKAGLFNENFASATNAQVIKGVGDGTIAMYPMLSDAVLATLAQNSPEAVKNVGIFALPADDSSKTALTVWQPNSVYISKAAEGDKLDASKKLISFINSKDGCTVQNAQITAAGPYVTSACTVPSDAAPMVADIQKYFDSGETAPALEFLSPVKGPNLENIAVAVGSGITSAQDGARQYDEDVKKQAQQLGLSGW
ncbi:ABC transporter substrate-binding protein [Paenarthrobacter nicotinovorans]|uniref:ABC transporter substrate-binding protein n=1 Tax=Paenarthrobacter nicotinovorans TaxID=29320 RepID=UPI0038145BC3